MDTSTIISSLATPAIGGLIGGGIGGFGIGYFCKKLLNFVLGIAKAVVALWLGSLAVLAALGDITVNWGRIYQQGNSTVTFLGTLVTPAISMGSTLLQAAEGSAMLGGGLAGFLGGLWYGAKKAK